MQAASTSSSSTWDPVSSYVSRLHARLSVQLNTLLTNKTQNIIVDIYILILPISTIWNLKNICMRRKIAVLCVIGFGGISVIIACCRIALLLQLGSSPDMSWVLGNMVIVSALEIQSAIIAVNLPSLKALWTKYTGSTAGGSSRQNLHRKAYRLSTISGDASSSASDSERRTRWSKRTSATRDSYWDNGLTSIASEDESVLGDMAVMMPIQWVRRDIRAIRVGRGYIVRSMMSMERVEDCFPVGHFLRQYGPRRDAESVVASLV